MRQELRRRLHEADPNLKIASGRKHISDKKGLMRAVPKVLSPREIEEWGLPPMIPIFPPQEILDIEAKWSKIALQEMCVEFWLDPNGDKELLIEKLIYIGVLDEDGERTDLEPKVKVKVGAE